MFFGSLMLATALPLFGLSFGAAPYLPGLWVFIAIAGYWHVSSTAFSYFDHDLRPLVKAEPWRFLWPVILLPTAMVALYLADHRLGLLAAVGYLFWQAHHYQRQNYGLCALAAGGRLPERLSLGLNLAALAGAFGMLRFPELSRGILPSSVIAASWTLGVAVYVGSALPTIMALYEDRRLLQPKALAFIGLSWAFFLPALFCQSLMAGFWSYAAAHGAQYLICQGLVVRGAKLSAPRLFIGAALMATIGTLAFVFRSEPIVIQAWLGLVMVHFLADAKLWRMREPLQRSIIAKRLSFAFQR